MTDLNTMMREQARGALQTALDAAVTNGDTVAATKIADDIAKLAVSTAPKAPPYNDTDIRAELEKLAPWYGTDPRKSAKAVEFAKNGLDIKKFATAALFAAAVVKAVDEEFKTPAAPGEGDDANGEGDDANGEGDDDNAAVTGGKKPGEPKPRRTDGPREGDAGTRNTARSAGPWTKLSDAPPETRKEINRQADKFVSAKAPKEQRESFIKNALASHYAIAERVKAARK